MSLRRWEKISLSVLAAVAVLVSCYVLGGFWLYGQLDSRYRQVKHGMSLLEVQRLAEGALVESAATVEQIVEEGYAVPHLSNGEARCAKKYAHHIFKSLYFYVIYDDDGKVQMAVPAYE